VTGPARVSRSSFHVFDATLYRGKPDLGKYGISSLPVFYQADLWPNSESLDRVPEKQVLETALTKIGPKSLVCLDVEHWQLGGSSDESERNIKNYIELVRRLHGLRKDLRLGYYGVAPVRDYWRAKAGLGSPKYIKWQFENRRLVTLVEAVDVVFPSIYTFYRDRDGWKQAAISQMKAARSYGKPVYVFLWPQYHDSNRLFGGHYIGNDYWRLQLDTVRQYADGVVIWGGWGDGGPKSWDEQASWWKITREFLVDIAH